jgi:hypothetical protein
MKRQRDPDAISSTEKGEKLTSLLGWLEASGTVGLSNLEFKSSIGQCGGSLGCFAKKNFVEGDVLFSVPQKCIMSFLNVDSFAAANLLREAAKALGNSQHLTSELLIWLLMCRERNSHKGTYSPYMQSLDRVSPSPLSWPKDLFESLEGTNIETMSNAATALAANVEFLNQARAWAKQQGVDKSQDGHEILDETLYCRESLTWARGHYLARRYPGERQQSLLLYIIFRISLAKE